MTRLGPLFTALALVGCTSSDSAVEVSIDLSALTLPAANPGEPMLDDAGLADLSSFPLFVVARVEADDLPAPVVALWPEVVPDEAPAEVALELEVSPGGDRRVSVELALAEEELPPAIFVAPAAGDAPETVDVTAGQVAEVAMELTELPVATLRATWPSSFEVSSVAWVEERMGVVLPPVAADGEAVEAELPAGRRYWPRVVLADGSSRDLDAQSILLDAAGTTAQLELEE